MNLKKISCVIIVLMFQTFSISGCTTLPTTGSTAWQTSDSDNATVASMMYPVLHLEISSYLHRTI